MYASVKLSAFDIMTQKAKPTAARTLSDLTLKHLPFLSRRNAECHA